eukprot:7229248-Pyramimonas_sp.AAC.1
MTGPPAAPPAGGGRGPARSRAWPHRPLMGGRRGEGWTPPERRARAPSRSPRSRCANHVASLGIYQSSLPITLPHLEYT